MATTDISAPSGRPKAVNNGPYANMNWGQQGGDLASPDNPAFQDLANRYASQINALPTSPGSAYSPWQIGQMSANALRQYQTQNRQNAAGAAGAMAGRGATGPNLSSMLQSQLDAQSRGLQQQTELAAKTEGLQLGNQQYANMVNALSTLGNQMGQEMGRQSADMNAIRSTNLADYLQQLTGEQQLGQISAQGEENRQTSAQENQQALTQMIQEYLNSSALSNQNSTQSTRSDILNSIMGMMADPNSMIKIMGDSKLNDKFKSTISQLINMYNASNTGSPQVSFSVDPKTGQITSTPVTGAVTGADAASRDLDQYLAAALGIGGNYPTTAATKRSGDINQYISPSNGYAPLSSMYQLDAPEGSKTAWTQQDMTNLNLWEKTPIGQKAVNALKQDWQAKHGSSTFPAEYELLLARATGADIGDFKVTTGPDWSFQYDNNIQGLLDRLAPYGFSLPQA